LLLSYSSTFVQLSNSKEPGNHFILQGKFARARANARARQKLVIVSSLGITSKAS
jgi:hypothetical protein